MPGTYTYPGIYVEEVPSGVRTIVGVSTAEAAFIDFFARGPTDRAERITSFGDFERRFGGLDRRSEASYAIQQYYLNGGQVGWVVRVPVGSAEASPQPSRRPLLGGSPAQATLTVEAANAGAWGDRLQVAVVLGASPDRFDLFVREAVTAGGRTQVLDSETYRNLTMAVGDRRYCVRVVNAASNLVRLANAGIGSLPTGVAPTPSGGAPDGAFQPLSGGTDGNAFDDAGVLTDAGGALMRQALITGLPALDRIDPFIFTILCLPAAALLDPGDMASVLTEAGEFCRDHRAFLIVDIPEEVNAVGTPAGVIAWMATNDTQRHENAAVYFPRLVTPDPLNEGRPRNVGPSGTMAGVYARTDATRGVWKAPAGTDASLRNASLALNTNDLDNGALNPLGINVLRNFPIFGNVCWGARTLEGADQQASEWKYIPVRRTALFIEESLVQGLKWVVFEPNDEPLWAQIRLNVGAFMHDLFRQGAFQGATPAEAYFVKCDGETTTQTDIDRGVVNILVGFAPLKPAEFVVIKIQQIAGQIET
jgi:phage tail sheath protein FI